MDRLELSKCCESLNSKLNRLILRLYNNRRYVKALQLMRINTQLKYYFSWQFVDETIENLLCKMSSTLTTRPIHVCKNKIVFYDASAKDNTILSQQYLRAVAASGLDVLYLTDTDFNSEDSRDIYSEALSFTNITVRHLPDCDNLLQKAQCIYDIICDFAPTKLLMQLMPNSVSEVMAFYALPSTITKYQINHTDHAYWVGYKCLDYSFVFRPYGRIVSNFARNIQNHKSIYLPYYPITPKVQSFHGLPIECDGKVVLFSGGTYHKVASKDNVFQKMIARILDENPNAVFLYAGLGDSSVFNYLTSCEKYKNRFILLGFRHDINEIFKHVDIYINTYPFGGGLMCQYAAVNGIPLIAYSSPMIDALTIESIVCAKDYVRVTFFDKEDFFSEIGCLIRNVNYRVRKGNALKQCVITEQDFNKLFIESISDNRSHISEREVDEEEFLKYFHPKMMSTVDDICAYVVKSLGIMSVIYAPRIFVYSFFSLFTSSGYARAIRKLKSLLYSK